MKKNHKVLLLDNFIEESGGVQKIFRPHFPSSVIVESTLASHGKFPRKIEDYTHIVVSGSAASPLSDELWVTKEREFLLQAFLKQIPILGVCFGHQLLGVMFGGRGCARRSPTPEFGWKKITLKKDKNPIFNGFQKEFYSYCSHFEEVVELPEKSFEILASTENCSVSAFQLKGHPVWGVQYHSEYGMESAKKGLLKIAEKYPELNLDCTKIEKDAKDSLTAPLLFENFLKA